MAWVDGRFEYGLHSTNQNRNDWSTRAGPCPTPAYPALRPLRGKIIVDYLFDLFAASPFEAFSRLGVLAVLDQVRKDQALFTESAKQVEPVAARNRAASYFRLFPPRRQSHSSRVLSTSPGPLGPRLNPAPRFMLKISENSQSPPRNN